MLFWLRLGYIGFRKLYNQEVVFNPDQIQEEKSKDTIIVFVLMGCILFLLFKKSILIYGVIMLSIIGIWLPKETLLIHVYWMTLSKYFSKIGAFILLTVSYLFILTPISFIQKIGDRDPLKLKVDKKKVDTYFKEKPRKVDPSRFEKMG